MNDTIKREDAIKAIEDLPNAYNGWSDTYDKAYIIGTLEEVPSAEKQGEWKVTNTYKDHNGRVVDRVEHTDCGYIWHREMGEPLHNYCPNCGARMKGADDE